MAVENIDSNNVLEMEIEACQAKAQAGDLGALMRKGALDTKLLVRDCVNQLVRQGRELARCKRFAVLAFVWSEWQSGSHLSVTPDVAARTLGIIGGAVRRRTTVAASLCQGPLMLRMLLRRATRVQSVAARV